MLQFKNATSYSDSIRLGNNYKDVIDVKDNNGKIIIKNEKVEIDHITGKDVLKINMNIFEKGTIIPSCLKCEACPEQKECENQSKNNNTFLIICLIISAIANVGLIITLKKIK